MTSQEKLREAAYQESLRSVPMTCPHIGQALRFLEDRYGITEDHFEFAYWLITRQTIKLRNALVDEIAGLGREPE